MEYLSPYIVAGFVFVFGLLIGSFLNVVIYRVPLGESIVLPASHCPHCNVAIKPYDNVPVLSYVVLGGKCRSCRAGISPIYPAIELLVAILFLLAFITVGKQFHIFDNHQMQVPARFWLTLAGDLAFVGFIVPLVFIDLRHFLLPDALTYPGLAVLFVLRVLAPDPWQIRRTPHWFGLTAQNEWALAAVGAVLGMLAGGGTLWLIRWAYQKLRHVEGMGLGDVKMMLMVGAFLGWQLTLLTIFIASLLGSLVGVGVMLARGSNMKMEIQFGVFLGPAALVALFVGKPLIDWYLGMTA
ncbi:MAG TPA: prepilin peptidase [Blastocatellia bacterium]|nr:prepilin peptidase [Blastocatellia bacterium]